MTRRIVPASGGALVFASVLSVGVTGLARPSDDAARGQSGALAAEKAHLSFELEPGLRIELVAAEPMIESPVALAFDERGRLYVAENRGYPTGPGPGQPPAGRIALLEDTDRDGRMDRRTTFAQGLTYPNGVMPWRGGLIVTCAPDVLFLRDNDGDGQADERRVLFTGFATSGSTQLRVSHPSLSVDNWIYLTSGLTGGRVVSPADRGRRAVVLGRTDFRFRPDGQEWEAADGGAQFGLTFDDFGRRFICYNRVQVQHVVIASQTLRRNPHLAFSETVQDCPAELLPEPLKGHGAAARLYPISHNVTTADSHAGTFTAACAVTVFRGTGLPAAYRGGVFSCDPAGNLVHFDRLEPRGATFTARRARSGTEFLASRDDWFRPVFLAHGPDGALYVCDMYRKTIEHPDYLPVEIRKRTDFDSGKTMGRIWRVVRDDARADDLRRLREVDLAAKTSAQLCAELRNPDGWRRDTAHRLLLERRDRAASAPLRSIVVDPQAPAVAVVNALHLLEALGALPDDLVRRSLRHPAAPVREHALQLAEPRLAREAGWLADVLPSSDDADARVRFQAAITLGAAGGSTEPPEGQRADRRGDDALARALARIAARDGSDRWTRAAVFSSVGGRELALLTALREQPRRADLLLSELLVELGRLLGTCPTSQWPLEVAAILADRPGFTPLEQAALLTGFAATARGRLATPAAGDVLSALVGPTVPGGAPALSSRALVESMKHTAADPAQPVERRITAVGLLAFTSFDRAGETLLGLMGSREPVALQAAAARAIASEGDARVARLLLAPRQFASYPPSLREEVLSALLERREHQSGLLDALEKGWVPLGAIDAQRRRQLTQNRDASVRGRASELFGRVAGDRAGVYESYKDVVNSKSDPARGRAVFRRECASCHRLDQEGYAVGPDLFGIRNQPKAAILLHLLVPDQEITPGFAAYTVATRDGRALTGLISSENPAGITLRQALGKEDTILRTEIEEISAGNQSLMPQGLEKTITRQEFADLLAYLKGEGGRDEVSAVAGGADQPAACVKCGFAERDITPEVGMEAPGGYGKSFHRSTHDPCKVRAAVFDDGQSRVAIVGLDALGIRRDTVKKVREAIQATTGIPAQSILIGASHSHSSGPLVWILPGEFDHASPLVQRLAYRESTCADPKYVALVERALIDAVREANDRRTIARAGVGKGVEATVAFNRRFLMRNGRTVTHPGLGNPDIVEPAGPVDPEVGVLGAWDAGGSRRLLGCIVNFACHATTSPGGISANYIHYLEKAIQGYFGKDCVVVFLAGASGDITQVDNRSPYKNPDGERWAQLVGGKVGAEAIKVLLTMEPGALAPVAARSRVWEIPRRVPSPKRVQSCLEIVRDDKKKVDPTTWTFAKEIVLLDALLSRSRAAEVEVQAVQVGPAVFVTTPAEYFCRFGLEIKAASGFPFTFPVSLANGCVGYVPTEDAFGPHGGGYETRLTSYSNLEITAGARMRDAGIELARQLKPGPAPEPPRHPPFDGQPWSYGNVPPERD